jgi:predicted N-acetyltransferase YhbS
VGEVTARPSEISSPAPIGAGHLTSAFSCGKPPLDNWLRERALRSEGRSARTYVATAGDTVVAYYCFAAASVRLDEVPKPLRRNMPNEVPVLLIGRLAVASHHQGQGLGKALLKDALLRSLQAAEIVGARAVMVHALDAEAAQFYCQRGFIAFPEHSRTFFMPMETIRGAL